MARKKSRRGLERAAPAAAGPVMRNTPAPAVKGSARRASARGMSVTVKVSPEEYQLISYAASASRARGVQTWMRDRVLEAARDAVPARTAESIIAGRPTAERLQESLDARAARRPARILAFGRPGKQDGT